MCVSALFISVNMFSESVRLYVSTSLMVHAVHGFCNVSYWLHVVVIELIDVESLSISV